MIDIPYLTHRPFPLAAWGKLKLFFLVPLIYWNQVRIVLWNWNYLTPKKGWFFLTPIILATVDIVPFSYFDWTLSDIKIKKNPLWCDSRSTLWLSGWNWIYEEMLSHILQSNPMMQLSLVFSRTMFCAFCT